MDHDQRFKTLIKTFFGEFLQLFFADWAARFDCDQVEWLDQEVFADPPEGSRRVLDLVAKLPTREPIPYPLASESDRYLALVHIEIESPDRAAPLRPRMFEAYVQLRRRHALPVLPIGLFLNVGLDGVGVDVYEETFWDFSINRFQYLYVGLPALDALKYVTGDNWLGVALAALMKVPKERAAWLGAEALRRITEAPLSDQQRFLLGECVQAYLRLDEAQKTEFRLLLTTSPYEGVQAMNTTWFEQGEQIGIQKGQRLLLRKQLEERFGPLSPRVVEQLNRLSAERLLQIGSDVLRAGSLQELGLDE